MRLASTLSPYFNCTPRVKRDWPEMVGGNEVFAGGAPILPMTLLDLADNLGTNPLPPKHRGVNYSQTTLPKHMRAMNAGMQTPVVTFTKAAVMSVPPMM